MCKDLVIIFSITYSTADLFVNQAESDGLVLSLFQDGQIDYVEFVAMMQGICNTGLGCKPMETSLNVNLRDAPQVH